MKRPRLRVVTHDSGKPVTGRDVQYWEEEGESLIRLHDVKAVTLHVGSRQGRLTATVTRLHHAAEVHYDDVVLGPIQDTTVPEPVPPPEPQPQQPPPVQERAMSEFAFVNDSKGRVSDADVRLICEALSQQLERFCRDWGYAVPVVSFYPAGATPPGTSWVVSLVDQPDVDGALAYHSDDDRGRPDAFVFAGFIQDNGGSVLSGANSVAGAASHEVLELLRDPACTLWVEMPLVGPDGKQYARVAAEVCDPVQSGVDSFLLSNDAGGPGAVHQVDLSAYVLPAWEDPLDSAGPFSSDGSLAHAGDVAPGGYAVYEDASGNVAQVMAEGFPEHLKQLKATHGRAGRRMLAAPNHWKVAYEDVPVDPALVPLAVVVTNEAADPDATAEGIAVPDDPGSAEG